MSDQNSYIPEALLLALQRASRITVLTGAGISAESGIPTFRDALTGLWAQYRPEELATPQAFSRNPKLVWDWYQWRRELVSSAQPNLGHRSLVIMERLIKEFTIITQNVDELHQKAGSKNLVEMHGSLFRSKCSREGIVIDTLPETDEIPPHCLHCGANIRPDVVWFGESLPDSAVQTAWEAAQNCDMFFSIGTSALVQPAASLSYVALKNEALVVELNITETPLSPDASFSLFGPAAEVLPTLLKSAWPEVHI